MTARSIRHIVILAVAAAAIMLPSSAIAGPSTEVSAVDAIASDASTDGSVDSSSDTTKSTASDSPTTDTYGGSGDSVPPPVTCDSSSSSGSSGSTSTDSSSSTGTDDCRIIECSAADTDGKDANGKPCVECSSFDTDGKDASGQPCVPVTTETVTETPCTDGSGSTSGGTEVCGGGGVEEPVEQPINPEPVIGGGEPLPVPAPAPELVAGGGGPELPFTGLPLWYAIFGGLGLMAAGGAFWMRGHFGHKG
jgi:hypothetical protein